MSFSSGRAVNTGLNIPVYLQNDDALYNDGTTISKTPHTGLVTNGTNRNLEISPREIKRSRLPIPVVKLTKIWPAGVNVPSTGEAAAAAPAAVGGR